MESWSMCVWRKTVWGSVWISIFSTTVVLGVGKNKRKVAHKKQAPVAAATSTPESKSAQTEQGTHKDLVYLAVSKRQLQAELRTLPEQGQESRVLHTFPIAIGKQEGDKEKS